MITPSRLSQQADLLNNLGDVLVAQGKLPEALDAYQQSLKIRQVLAEQDKTNSGWQRDLAMSYARIGEVLEAQGKLPEALDAYRDYFDISDMLASRDPSNATWQNGAAWSRYCIANVLLRIKDGDRNEARRLVAEGIEIMKRLGRHAELDMAGRRSAQEDLNKLNELANALGLSSKE